MAIFLETRGLCCTSLRMAKLELLSCVQVLILSGHDHDQCTVTHMSKHGPVMEVGV